MNLFGFVGNNPMRYIDAHGHGLLSFVCGQGWSGEAADAFEESIGESAMEQWDETTWSGIQDRLADRYADTMLEYGDASTAAIVINDITGGTALVESIAGIDLQSQTELNGQDRVQRGLIGGGGVVISGVGGASLINSARAGYTGTGLRLPGLRSGEKPPEVVATKPKCPPDGACFVAGTLVTTEDGLRPIEDVKQGEKVWAEDEQTGEVALKEVLNTMSHDDDELVLVELGDVTIEATPEHPFWVEGIGWTGAAKLEPGQLAKTKNGTLEITKVTRHAAHVLVFNLEVGGFHTYFVSSASVLVHNQGKSISRKPGKLGERKGTDALRAENEVLRRAESEVGGLDIDQSNRLHHKISGKGYSYEEILQEAKWIKGIE
jgi:Pretoxin HINT domain